MRVIVTGGRNYQHKHKVWNTLNQLDEMLRLSDDRITAVIHGDCPTGADAFASEWCGAADVDEIAFPADWDQHGKAAGPIRNSKLLECGAEICLSFSGGAGTADMTRKAKAAGLKVIEIE